MLDQPVLFQDPLQRKWMPLPLNYPHLLHGIQVPDANCAVFRDGRQVAPQWVDIERENTARMRSHNGRVTAGRNIEDSQVTLCQTMEYADITIGVIIDHDSYVFCMHCNCRDLKVFFCCRLVSSVILSCIDTRMDVICPQ